jgi:hypothetical protein
MISQDQSILIKTYETIASVAHNLKVVSSNLAPATKVFNGLEKIQRRPQALAAHGWHSIQQQGAVCMTL